jgi:putative ABC transport system ATP-binding protein
LLGGTLFTTDVQTRPSPPVAAPIAPLTALPIVTPAARAIVFRARGLTKTYHMGDVDVPALRSVDFDLYEGELVVLLGASGSGKSTLLNILGGLDVATSGSAAFRGLELEKMSERELTHYRRESVGFVFQFYNLIPSLTARENVELVTDIAVHPMPAVEALRLVGLGDRIDHFPAQMSGGEQQRVAMRARSPSGRTFSSATNQPARSTRKPDVSCCIRLPT